MSIHHTSIYDVPTREDLEATAGLIRASGGPVEGTILSLDGGESWEQITASDAAAQEREDRRIRHRLALVDAANRGLQRAWLRCGMETT